MKKYNSLWQVLNAQNDIEGKYKVLEALVDGVIAERDKKLVEKLEEMKKDTVCKSGECKVASYPTCRHSMGYNDSLSDALSIIKELK